MNELQDKESIQLKNIPLQKLHERKYTKDNYFLIELHSDQPIPPL